MSLNHSKVSKLKSIVQKYLQREAETRFQPARVDSMKENKLLISLHHKKDRVNQKAEKMKEQYIMQYKNDDYLCTQSTT